jgi:hypothetical protein
MRYWGYPAPPEELAKVAEAADAFRRFWGRINPQPFPCKFDGTSEDVRALDFLAYEGIGYGEMASDQRSGIERAALVCGEVLRRAAGFEWVISYRGDWMVAPHEDDGIPFAFCPLARLHEAECAVGWGRHGWVVEQGALMAYAVLDDAKAERRTAKLLAGLGSDYRQMLQRTVERLGGPT